jgi:hypothetical protein
MLKPTLLAVTLLATLPVVVLSQTQPPTGRRGHNPLDCSQVSSGLCPDATRLKYQQNSYIGHDEPSLLFYSNEPGSGNSSLYRVTLPRNPPTLPKQDGTGGTFEFQLDVAFWFGMVLCDSQSFPNFTHVCKPDTDDNIFDDSDPASERWIGHHPGGAFLELQFYPPGWVNSFCFDQTHWCAALNIFSEQIDGATGTPNNFDCLSRALGGVESVNHAFITKDGIPIGPANPLSETFGNFNPDLSNVLQMDDGDRLVVLINDTAHGLKVRIRDLTTGESGFIVAGPAAGFGQLVYDPSAAACSVKPYAFHPMYSTSSEHTRTPWTAHSYNVAFAEEIGHFEYCAQANAATLGCSVPRVNSKAGPDDDDNFCFSPSEPGFPPEPIIQIGGCTAADVDFDGVSYRHSWPGTIADHREDKKLHPTPVRFTSPMFLRREKEQESDDERRARHFEDYDRVAFEADLPLIETATVLACDVFDGTGCVDPPNGARFYPIFSTAQNHETGCEWQFGGTHILETENTFGGRSTSEFGSILGLAFQDFAGTFTAFENFRRILDANPCAVRDHDKERDTDDTD